MAEERFKTDAMRYYPKLSYLKGDKDSDTTQTWSSVDPAKIDFLRTLGAMLSVFWVCSQNYEPLMQAEKRVR